MTWNDEKYSSLRKHDCKSGTLKWNFSTTPPLSNSIVKRVGMENAQIQILKTLEWDRQFCCPFPILNIFVDPCWWNWFEFPKLPGLTAFLHKVSISIHQPLTLNAIGSTGNPPIPPVAVVPDPSASGGLHGTLDFDIQQEVHDFIQLQQDLFDQFLWPKKINPTGR